MIMEVTRKWQKQLHICAQPDKVRRGTTTSSVPLTNLCSSRSRDGGVFAALPPPGKSAPPPAVLGGPWEGRTHLSMTT